MQGLIEKYKLLFADSQPQWAQKQTTVIGVIPPTIPFIGKNYHQSKVLVYASAENLSHYSGYLESNDIDIYNRHRYFFDRDGSQDEFFPMAHCTPINDGSLTLASAFVCQMLRAQVSFQTPTAYLESISFANFGKFSIQADENNKRNIDYANNMTYLQDSLLYVQADLLQLKPNYVILPKSIYDHIQVRNLLDNCVPHAISCPIYQINVGNVNRIISRNFCRKPIDDLPPVFKVWFEHLGWSGKSKDNYRSVFTYLESSFAK